MSFILRALEHSPARSPNQTKQIITLLHQVSSAGNGMKIRFQEDFARLRDLTEANPDRDTLSPMFDPSHCDVSGKNAFWIEGLCPDGHVAHVQAVRYDDLEDRSLCQHWVDNSFLFTPPGVDVDLRHSRFDAAPASQTIRGRTCYHGEL